MNQTPAITATGAASNGIRARWNAAAGVLARWIGRDLLALACRISMAALLLYLIGRGGGAFSVDRLMKVA